MRRFDRILPWALYAAIGAFMLLGLTWNASFESTPANTDLVSQGDDRIRELKAEIRARNDVEHCFGSGGGSGCTTDSGFHREGSARAFYETAAPTVLLNPSATALGAADDGRLWVDSDGQDATPATADDALLYMWDGTAFAALRAAGVVLVDAATVNDNQIFDIGTIDTAPANLVMSGGAGAGGLPMATVPAAGEWDIMVSGNFAVNYSGTVGSPVPRVIVFRLQEQIGAGAFATVAWCTMMTDANSATNELLGTCTYSYGRAGTVSSTYTYRVRVSTFTPTTETDDIIVDSSSANHDVEAETVNTGYLRTVLRRRG